MSSIVEKYLGKLETMLDLEHQRQARRLCQRVYDGEETPELPYVLSDASSAKDQDWPKFAYNDTFADRQKMLLDQLRAPFFHNQLRDNHPLNIRTNYGTPILPSIFGLGFQLTETSLPWTHHLESREQVQALIEQGVPDTHSGLGGRCFETAAYYREALKPYPKLTQAISIYHPDLQGPFDVAHLIWGPDIFYALYDCPEVVHQLLALVTKTYVVWMRAWKQFIGEGNDFTTHWNFYIRGGIMLRNDTAVTISAQHYEEFVKPYDQALLDEFGGCIHFCGRGSAFIASMCRSRNLYGINMSQPDWNDTPNVIAQAQQNGLVMIALRRAYIPAGARRGFIALD